MEEQETVSAERGAETSAAQASAGSTNDAQEEPVSTRIVQDRATQDASGPAQITLPKVGIEDSTQPSAQIDGAVGQERTSNGPQHSLKRAAEASEGWQASDGSSAEAAKRPRTETNLLLPAVTEVQKCPADRLAAQLDNQSMPSLALPGGRSEIEADLPTPGAVAVQDKPRPIVIKQEERIQEQGDSVLRASQAASTSNQHELLELETSSTARPRTEAVAEESTASSNASAAGPQDVVQAPRWADDDAGRAESVHDIAARQEDHREDRKIIDEQQGRPIVVAPNSTPDSPPTANVKAGTQNTDSAGETSSELIEAPPRTSLSPSSKTEIPADAAARLAAFRKKWIEPQDPAPTTSVSASEEGLARMLGLQARTARPFAGPAASSSSGLPQKPPLATTTAALPMKPGVVIRPPKPQQYPFNPPSRQRPGQHRSASTSSSISGGGNAQSPPGPPPRPPARGSGPPGPPPPPPPTHPVKAPGPPPTLSQGHRADYVPTRFPTALPPVPPNPVRPVTRPEPPNSALRVPQWETVNTLSMLHQKAGMHAARAAFSPENDLQGHSGALHQGDMNDARQAVKDARSLAAKATIRLDPTVKHSSCSACQTPLLAGLTATVRILTSGPHGRVIKTECSTCGYSFDIPAPPLGGQGDYASHEGSMYTQRPTREHDFPEGLRRGWDIQNPNQEPSMPAAQASGQYTRLLSTGPGLANGQGSIGRPLPAQEQNYPSHAGTNHTYSPFQSPGQQHTGDIYRDIHRPHQPLRDHHNPPSSAQSPILPRESAEYDPHAAIPLTSDSGPHAFYGQPHTTAYTSHEVNPNPAMHQTQPWHGLHSGHGHSGPLASPGASSWGYTQPSTPSLGADRINPADFSHSDQVHVTPFPGGYAAPSSTFSQPQQYAKQTSHSTLAQQAPPRTVPKRFDYTAYTRPEK
ncbi:RIBONUCLEASE P SUBUNIT [Ceraceosorus bombacis]|uniref:RIBONUCLEASE P SUBUNIT n=1 Tax=Ceraceosorus bombacis TaxID=401625 RepID=A0A0P1BSA6_9BASI|nr:RIBONUCLEASE P SUBUNIT [Ceraceosorus bombacis]